MIHWLNPSFGAEPPPRVVNKLAPHGPGPTLAGTDVSLMFWRIGNICFCLKKLEQTQAIFFEGFIC